MKKVKKFIKPNIKTVVAFIIGLILAGGSAVVVYALTATQITYTDTNGIGETTVQGAIDKLYMMASSAGASGTIGMKSGDYNPSSCTTPTLNVGDYVSITPTADKFYLPASLLSNKQYYYFSPQILNLWRVIKKNDCNVEVVSEYAAAMYGNTKIKMTGSKTGYKDYLNYVGVLNIIASSFENSDYTVGSRAMGFDGQTEFLASTSALDKKTNDTKYESDIDLVRAAYNTGSYGKTGLKTKSAYLGTYGGSSISSGQEKYCIASRSVSTSYGMTSFSFRYVEDNYGSSDTDLNTQYFYYYMNPSSPSFVTSEYDCSIRPILILKTGVTTAGGSGTKSDPYTLS